MGLKQFSHSILSCRVSSSLYPKDLMSSDFVTGPKSVCLMFQRLKVKTSEFGVSFIDVESAIREEGRPNPQIHLTGVQSSDFFMSGEGEMKGDILQLQGKSQASFNQNCTIWKPRLHRIGNFEGNFLCRRRPPLYLGGAQFKLLPESGSPGLQCLLFK